MIVHGIRPGIRVFLLAVGVVLGVSEAAAQVPPLSALPIPAPPNLGDFVRDRQAAIVLGKALFWDMQVGSDGVACGSCHFRAGADPRTKNQISPGLLRVAFQKDEAGNPTAVPAPDRGFEGQGPNYQMTSANHPFRLLANPRDRESAIVRDSNNVASSQGVFYSLYGQSGYPGRDPDGFWVGQGRRGANVRRVEPRNTPTMINAVFNHRNFWDMRAQDQFNGVNPFGARDPNAFVYRADDPAASPVKVRILLENSSLASQAVGPPTNAFEMSADGRTFPDVARSLMVQLARYHRSSARRLRSVRPLARQLVHPNDSVLGPYSRWPSRGLTVDYEGLVRRAFRPRWWNSEKRIRVAQDGTTRVVSPRFGFPPSPDDLTLMEYNFSLFFGLAVQLYEATLVSDDTPFDRFLRDPAASPLPPAAERGRQVFFNLNAAPAPRGNCQFCHSGALLSEASVDSVATRGPIRTSNGQVSDTGTRNIGVRETTDDLGNGAYDPFGVPLSVAVRDSAPGSVLAADGTFKIPALRNVALTAPYFHNGGEETLADVVSFYSRGGNQGGASNPIHTRDGTVVGGLSVLGFNTAPEGDAVRADLVAFLESLTDERVRISAAPFDHPQILVPNGHPGNEFSVQQRDGYAVDAFLDIPATGRSGGPVP
jgi:cytochrome c peroxidase